MQRHTIPGLLRRSGLVAGRSADPKNLPAKPLDHLQLRFGSALCASPRLACALLIIIATAMWSRNASKGILLAQVVAERGGDTIRMPCQVRAVRSKFCKSLKLKSENLMLKSDAADLIRQIHALLVIYVGSWRCAHMGLSAYVIRHVPQPGPQRRAQPQLQLASGSRSDFAHPAPAPWRAAPRARCAGNGVVGIVTAVLASPFHLEILAVTCASAAATNAVQPAVRLICS